MKDAKGHGSDAGLHSGGVQATPKLQRRHFEAIAAELKGRNAAPDEVHAMAEKLATTNPGFRRDFFVAAATGGDYRFKGPGNNAAAVSRKAKKVSGSYQPDASGARNSPLVSNAKSKFNETFNKVYGDPAKRK